MDRTALLSALTAAIESAPQDDVVLYRAAAEPSHADQRLVRLLEQLRQTPELEGFNNGMQVVANTAGRVELPALAWWLLVRAGQVRAAQTLEDLLWFLAASELPYRMTLALGGITLDSSGTLDVHFVNPVPVCFGCDNG